MRIDTIARRRLVTQRLVGPRFRTAAEAVRALGAVQAQDYSGAKWALGQRVAGLTDAGVDAALAAGQLIRTHVLRPTWHFVAPEDLRWMLALTAPRVQQRTAHYYRQYGLDARLLERSAKTLGRHLAKRQARTREELGALLEMDGVKLGHALMYAELEGVICSGPRRGKQFTWTGIDDWVPPTKPKTRDEALAELTLRFFGGHGPAQVADFAMWASLTRADVTRGLGLVGKALASETHDGRTHWFVEASRRAPERSPVVHLLPNYDELLIAYKDRSAAYDPRNFARPPNLLAHLVTVDGCLVGGWRRLGTDGRLDVQLSLGRALTKPEHAALGEAAAALQRFTGVPVSLVT